MYASVTTRSTVSDLPFLFVSEESQFWQMKRKLPSVQAACAHKRHTMHRTHCSLGLLLENGSVQTKQNTSLSCSPTLTCLAFFALCILSDCTFPLFTAVDLLVPGLGLPDFSFDFDTEMKSRCALLVRL